MKGIKITLIVITALGMMAIFRGIEESGVNIAVRVITGACAFSLFGIEIKEWINKKKKK